MENNNIGGVPPGKRIVFHPTGPIVVPETAAETKKMAPPSQRGDGLDLSTPAAQPPRQKSTRKASAAPTAQVGSTKPVGLDIMRQLDKGNPITLLDEGATTIGVSGGVTSRQQRAPGVLNQFDEVGGARAIGDAPPRADQFRDLNLIGPTNAQALQAWAANRDSIYLDPPPTVH